MLSQEDLKSQLNYNPNSGEFHWKVGHCVGQLAGYTDKRDYVWIRINDKLELAHLLAWLYMTGYWPNNLVDHRDRKANNNKFINLREADKSDNAINSKIREDNTSGHKGVSWHKQRCKWQMKIKKGNVKLSKLCNSFDEAVAFYQAAARKLHGEFLPSESSEQTENVLPSEGLQNPSVILEHVISSPG